MLVGRFGNTTGRPYIEGRLIFPKLGLTGDISFLADTGADKTVLMPIDGARLGIDYTKLKNSVITIGVGGEARDFVEPGVLIFVEAGLAVHAYGIDVYVAALTSYNATIPSLLGRDIMDRWAITFDRSKDRLTAEVRSADETELLGQKN